MIFNASVSDNGDVELSTPLTDHWQLATAPASPSGIALPPADPTP